MRFTWTSKASALKHAGRMSFHQKPSFPLRKKIAFQFLVSNMALVANFALTVILARLLTPTDIGIFSMSAVLIAVAHVFRDFGVTAFLKQEKTLSKEIMRGAIGLLVAASWTVAAVMYLSAPLWAAFFKEPKVSDVVEVLALGFVFIPLGAVPQALLVREMDVAKSAWVTLTTTTVYFVVSILLAYSDFKHMTMAWANLINIVVSGIAFNVVLKTRLPWLPSTYGWKRISSFGTGNLASSLLRALDNAIPDIALGKLSSPASVGLFSRANSTVNMIGTVLHPTIYFFALPFLARTHHAHGSLHKEFLKGSSIINCLMMPALIWIAIVAQDVVRILYGNQWLAASEAIPWLSLAIAATNIFVLSSQAVTGIGKPHAVIPAVVATLCFKGLLIYWLFDGSLKSFAMAIALGQVAAVPAFVWINVRYLKVPVIEWIINLCKPVPAWLAGGVTLYLVHELLPTEWFLLARLSLSSAIFAAITLAMYMLLNIPIRDELIQLLQKLKSAKFTRSH